MTIYGLQWTQATDAYVRLESAYGLTAGANFNGIGPWDMKRCNLWDDGTVTANYGDRCYTDTDVANMGQAMVQIPKFWYTTDHGGGVYKWWISTTGADAEPAGHDHDWHIHPAFCRMSTLLDNAADHNEVGDTAIKCISSTGYVAGDTVFIKDSAGCETRTIATVTGATDIELTAGLTNTYTEAQGAVISRVKDYIYVSAYEAYFNATDSKLESKSGATPTTSKTLAQFRTAAQLRKGAANYWEIQDYLSTCAVQLLFLIEYGTFNAQTTLGRGYTGAIAIQNTGATGIGGAYASGNASYGLPNPAGGDGTKPVSYRGIENLYGNISAFLDGLNIKANYAPWIADHDFSTNYEAYGHPYINSTATPLSSTADGYISDIKVDATYDYGFLPSAAAGTSATKIPDQYISASGNRVTAYGGGVAIGSNAGSFTIFAHISSGEPSSTGARLMYIG